MDSVPFHILALFWTEGGSARDCIFAFEKLSTSLKKTLLNVMILPRPSNVWNKKNIHSRDINQLKNACNLQIRKIRAMILVNSGADIYTCQHSTLKYADNFFSFYCNFEMCRLKNISLPRHCRREDIVVNPPTTPLTFSSIRVCILFLLFFEMYFFQPAKSIVGCGPITICRWAITGKLQPFILPFLSSPLSWQLWWTTLSNFWFTLSNFA